MKQSRKKHSPAFKAKVDPPGGRDRCSVAGEWKKALIQERPRSSSDTSKRGG